MFKTLLIFLLIVIWVGISYETDKDKVNLYGSVNGYTVIEDTLTPYYQYMVPAIGKKDTTEYKLGKHEVEIVNPDNK